MARDDLVQLEGVVTEVKAGNHFMVRTDKGMLLAAQLSGRMRKFRIRVVPGDRVVVSVSPYDLSHGLITYRPK
ncbi:MAG TPA: translation initiation factor IF-1 [Thermodesulfobacteriota bacterium]|nr:translation initiation factor IF-1 [Thermodesulfobacteriota bacterium]